MHTPLCGHAREEPVEFVAAAHEQGISLITFTCHTPISEEGFRQAGIRMHENQLPTYFAMVDEAHAFGETVGVEVRVGIEAEIFPDEEHMADMDRILRGQPFDFVLGSLHHQLPIYRERVAAQGLTDDTEIVRRYFLEMADGIRSGRYHSIAHPDVIRIYGTVDRFEPEELVDAFAPVIDAAVETDTCLEVNTSGLIKGVYQVHPDPLFLRLACERGVKLTMGSDAHTPSQVGQEFDHVYGLMREAGFTRMHYFREGTRFELPIPEPSTEPVA